LGDNYETELKTFIEKQSAPNKFKCYPFLNAKEIRKLYCAADTGIWLKAAISIQEAMGTGLPVILEDKPSVNHLIKHGENGWFFKKGTLAETIEKAVNTLAHQKESRVDLVAQNSKMLSYDAIAKNILDGITK
jgi:glycosyltransferase involved in cell wall biosynthesis